MRLFNIGDQIILGDGRKGVINGERSFRLDGGNGYDVLMGDREGWFSDNYICLDNSLNTKDVLTEPVTQLAVVELPVMSESLAYTPISINFDKEKFINYALAIRDMYKGIVLTNDNESELKALSTALNKVAKQLNEERLRIQREIDAPVKQFKLDVDQVVKIIADTQSAIKVQLDENAQAKRDKKRAEVQIIFDGFVAGSVLPENYLARVVLKDEYLNAATSMKKIKEDIQGQIAQLEEDRANELKAQEAEVERLRTRVTVYESLVKAFPSVSLDFASLAHKDVSEFAEVFSNKLKLMVEMEGQRNVALEKGREVHQAFETANFQMPPNVVVENEVTVSLPRVNLEIMIDNPYPILHGIPYVIDLRVVGHTVDSTLASVLTLISLAEEQGLTVELLTQI